MPTYTVTLSLTTNHGDPAHWSWPALVGCPVRVVSKPNNRRTHNKRDGERQSIVDSLAHAMHPCTSREVAERTGLTLALVHRLMFELKKRKQVREVNRDASGAMLYEVA